MTAVLSERDGLVLVEFDPATLGIFAKPTSSERYEPVTLSDAMWDQDVLAALDGPMFGNCDPGSSYATSNCADPRFAQLDQSVGVSDPPNRGEENSGVSVSIVDGLAIWSGGSGFDRRATVGVQMYPALVMDGEIQATRATGSNADRVKRAAVAGLANGRLAFCYAIDTMAGFARRIRDAGAVWAGYTDGGGSTALGYRDPQTGAVRRFISSEDRPVAMFLVARRGAHRGASISESTASTAAIVAAVGVGVIGLAALGIWAYARSQD